MSKKENIKTTYVKLTFGFNKNKFSNPGVYRKGKGLNLYDALVNLFRQRGNNFLPDTQRAEIINQFKLCIRELEQSKYVNFESTAGKIE